MSRFHIRSAKYDPTKLTFPHLTRGSTWVPDSWSTPVACQCLFYACGILQGQNLKKNVISERSAICAKINSRRYVTMCTDQNIKSYSHSEYALQEFTE